MAWASLLPCYAATCLRSCCSTVGWAGPGPGPIAALVIAVIAVKEGCEVCARAPVLLTGRIHFCEVMAILA